MGANARLEEQMTDINHNRLADRPIGLVTLTAERDRLREVNAELLAALKGLVAELESVSVPAPGLFPARAAIARAEGKGA